MAEIGPATARQFAQGRVQENPSAAPAGRVVPFPEVPGRHSAQAEARTSRRMPDTPSKTAEVARTGGVALQFVGGTIINLVAE